MREFHRVIFFTSVPIDGFYKYQNIFQFFPADLENMPTSSFQKHFPNIMEFEITDEDIKNVRWPDNLSELKEKLSSTHAIQIKLENILELLTTFTNHLFFTYSDQSGAWGFPMPEDLDNNKIESLSSKWCLSLFHYPEIVKHLKREEFTKPKIQEIKKLPHIEYYFNNPNLDFDKDKNILLPTSIDELFEAYFSLDPIQKEIVDTAISYNSSAIKLMSSSKTLSLLASFTAMETMVNLEYKDIPIDQCVTCNQNKYSVAKKFRDYLLKYVASSNKSKKKFNDYYNLRSKIVHTGRQLKTETLFTDLSSEERKDEFIKRIEILQIGKLSIVNWLLMHEAFKIAIKKNDDDKI